MVLVDLLALDALGVWEELRGVEVLWVAEGAGVLGVVEEVLVEKVEEEEVEELMRSVGLSLRLLLLL